MKTNRNVTLHQEIFPSFRMGPLLPESFTPLILNHTNLNLLAKTSAVMSRHGLSTFPEDWMPLITAKQTIIHAANRHSTIFQFRPPLWSMVLVMSSV